MMPVKGRERGRGDMASLGSAAVAGIRVGSWLAPVTPAAWRRWRASPTGNRWPGAALRQRRC